MKTMLKTEQVTLTPKIAHQLLTNNENNRNLRMSVVEKYARDIINNEWKLTGEPIQIDWNGNLINGQHRCQAVILADKSIDVFIISGLDPKTQSVIDVSVKRTAVDALRWAGFNGDLTIVSSLARLDTFHRSNSRFHTGTTTGALVPLTHSEIVDWANEHSDEAFSAARFGQQHYKVIGANPSLVAFARMLTNRVDELASDIFWSEIVEMRTSGLGDPRLTLIRTLAARKDADKNTPIGAQLFYMLRAWNAWRMGEVLQKMPIATRGRELDIPEAI